jgi:hypothetical protein
MPLEQAAHRVLGERERAEGGERLPAFDEGRASAGDDGNAVIGQPADSDV